MSAQAERGRYDVVVVGGGPGGATAAAFLAMAGRRVVVLERSRFPRFHIGESLLPASWRIWERLGIADRINAAGFAKKKGVLFSLFARQDEFFGVEEVLDTFPRGYTFHVRRSDFDQLLLDRARELGAEVRHEAHVRDLRMDEEGCVRGVSGTGPDGVPFELEAEIVVDATGRDTLVARKLGLRQEDPALRKVSYFTHYRGAYNPADSGAPTQTDIFAVDGAWIWYIPLDSGVTSVGVVMDMEHPEHRARGSAEELFERFVARAPVVAERLAGAERVEKVRGIPDISYANRRFAGDGYVMVGDAASFVDPIFSSGVHLAMTSGELAAAAVDESLARGGDTGPLDAYEAELRAQTGNIFAMIRNWYTLLEGSDQAGAVREFGRVARMPLLRRQFLLLSSGLYDTAERMALLEGGAGTPVA